ncbi:hypothetical protein [Rhodospirillaceae bacterium SYSU D60014]|uniref:hypothetical protein n=1 Tax=Virgifigura deserti TaxID=2268457 RepID=UPI0013C4B449
MSTLIDRPARQTRSAVAWAVLALSLSACNPLAPFAPTETELLQAGFIEPDRFPPPRPSFCYRTLAEADCFVMPQPGEAHRLVGAYAPAYMLID